MGKNLEKQRRTMFESTEMPTPYHDKAMIWLDKNVRDHWGRFAPSDETDNAVINLKTWWERPIASPNGFVVGFVDLWCEFDSVFTRDRKTDNGEIVYPEGKSTHYVKIYEVKPKIESLGALIRQVNFYRHFLPEAHFVVVSKFSEEQEDVLYRQEIETLTLYQGYDYPEEDDGDEE